MGAGGREGEVGGEAVGGVVVLERKVVMHRELQGLHLLLMQHTLGLSTLSKRSCVEMEMQCTQCTYLNSNFTTSES